MIFYNITSQDSEHPNLHLLDCKSSEETKCFNPNMQSEDSFDYVSIHVQGISMHFHFCVHVSSAFKPLHDTAQIFLYYHQNIFYLLTKKNSFIYIWYRESRIIIYINAAFHTVQIISAEHLNRHRPCDITTSCHVIDNQSVTKMLSNQAPDMFI